MALTTPNEIRAIYTALEAIAHDMRAEYIRSHRESAKPSNSRADYFGGIAYACDMYGWQIESTANRLKKFLEEIDENLQA